MRKRQAGAQIYRKSLRETLPSAGQPSSPGAHAGVLQTLALLFSPCQFNAPTRERLCPEPKSSKIAQEGQTENVVLVQRGLPKLLACLLNN